MFMSASSRGSDDGTQPPALSFPPLGFSHFQAGRLLMVTRWLPAPPSLQSQQLQLPHRVSLSLMKLCVPAPNREMKCSAEPSVSHRLTPRARRKVEQTPCGYWDAVAGKIQIPSCPSLVNSVSVLTSIPLS